MKPKDWLNEGLDAVNTVFDKVQASYDALPDKARSAELLTEATTVITKEIDGNFKCKFDSAKKAIAKASKKKHLVDPEKTFKRIERAISRDVRECFKLEYGEIL